MESDMAIKLSNITKTYGSEAHALKGVSVSIKKGDIFGIIGKSGAGKSTMIKLIGMLEKPTSGEIMMLGQDISKISQHNANEMKHKIGTVFQGYNLLMQRSVFKNVAFPLELSKFSKKDIKERCSDVLNLVGLSEKINSYPAQLSGGQKQRVAIARALAPNPNILLCDEPTSALDSFTTKEILKLLKNINENLGITIIIITHNISVVKAICKHMAVLEEGLIVEDGEVSEILKNPKSEPTKLLLENF